MVWFYWAKSWSTMGFLSTLSPNIPSESDWIFSACHWIPCLEGSDAARSEATAFPQSVASEQPELRGGKPDGSHGSIADVTSRRLALNHNPVYIGIWAMVNTHYMVDGHPIHNKDPYNGYYKSLWTMSIDHSSYRNGLGLLRSELRKCDQIWLPEVDHPQIPSVCWSRRLTATDSPPMLAWQGMMSHI